MTARMSFGFCHLSLKSPCLDCSSRESDRPAARRLLWSPADPIDLPDPEVKGGPGPICRDRHSWGPYRILYILYLPAFFTIKITHLCRQIYQSHGFYGLVGNEWEWWRNDVCLTSFFSFLVKISWTKAVDQTRRPFQFPVLSKLLLVWSVNMTTEGLGSEPF